MPQALSIGVDYDVFWRLNPRLLKSFVDADRLKKRQKEVEYYMLGRYTFDAVSIALANAFREKGRQPVQWLEEPYRLMPLTDEEQEARAAEEREKIIAFFNSMIPENGDGTCNG